MGFFSIELCLFVATLFAYTRLRNMSVFPINMIRGLTLYLPPTQADFETLESTSKTARETLQGKKNKYDQKHESKQVKFPLRSLQISEELLHYCKDFFAEFELLLMLFSVVIVLFVTILLIKVVMPDQIETNLVLYLTIITIAIALQSLNKDAFALGYFKWSDETKI
jgi:hypothetical protein